jgi:hypothetical protein
MPQWGPWVAGAIFLVVAVAVFILIYLAVPGPAGTHYNALLTIGIVAVIFGLAAYLSASFSRRPIVQRAAAWGFFAMGYATLLLTVGFVPNPTIGVTDRLTGFIIIMVFLGFTVLGIYWRSRSLVSQSRLQAGRREWESRPAPSAFNYSTAQQSTAAPPPAPANVPPTPPPASPPTTGGR